MSINGDIDGDGACSEVEVKQNVDHADEVNGTSGENEENINGAGVGEAGERTSCEDEEIEENFQDAKDEEIKEKVDDAVGINVSPGSGEGEENIGDAAREAGGGISSEIQEINENVDDVDGTNGTSGEGEENIDGAEGSEAGRETSDEDGKTESSGEEDPVKLFSLPSDEVLEHEFGCAYQNIISPDGHGEIFLLEGRGYIFVHFICFYSEFLGQKIKHKIPFHLITRARTEQRRGILQNAIEIIADDEVFLFATTSVEAFKLVNDKWQKNHNDPQTISEELAAYTVSYSTSVSTPSWIMEDVDAPSISEKYTMVLESKFSMKAAAFFRFLFSDNARGFQDTLHVHDEDFKCSRWRPDEFGYVRDMSSKHEFWNITADSFIGRYKEVQKFRAYKNSHLVITTFQEIYDESNDEHYFNVEAIWDVQRVCDESENECICRIYVHVDTIKADFGEGNVEQSIVDNFQKTYEKWIEEAHDTRDSIKDMEGLESGIVRVHVIDGEGPKIHDLNEQVILKYEFEDDDDSLRFEGSPMNFAENLKYRQEFAEAFLGLQLGSQTAMIIPPMIRNSANYALIYVKLKGIGDEKIEEDSSDSESDSEAAKLEIPHKEVLLDTESSEIANTIYYKTVKSLVAGTIVACCISVIMGVKRAKKTRRTSLLSSGIGNTLSITKAMNLTQEKGRHPAEIMYQVVTVGEGNSITKYQLGCFMYIKTGSVEPISFEGSPTELAIKLASGYEEAIGSTAPDEESIITRMEGVIVGMKVNERRKITIPPVVSCLRKVLYVDLTLMKIKDPPLPRKNNIFASKM